MRLEKIIEYLVKTDAIFNKAYWAVIVVSAGLFAFTLWCIFVLGFDMFTRDEWRMQNDYFNYDFLRALIYKQNGHSMIFPNLIYMANNYLSSANNKIIILINMFIHGTIFFILSRGVWKHKFFLDGRNFSAKIMLVALILLTVFWMAARVKLFWAIGIHNYLAALGATFSALGLYYFHKNNFHINTKSGLFIALGLVLANFSFGIGFAVWGMAVIMLLISRSPKKVTFIFVVLSILVAYLIEFIIPGAHKKVNFFENGLQIFSRLQIALSFIGSAFIQHRAGSELARMVSIFFGTVGFFYLLYNSLLIYLKRKKLDYSIVSVGIMWFIVSASLVISLTRLDYGLNIGVSPRYSSWSVLFWSGALTTFFIQLLNSNYKLAAKRWIMIFSGIIVIFFSVMQAAEASQYQMQAKSFAMRAFLAFTIGDPESHENEIKAILFRDGKILENVSNELKKRRRNIYRENWPFYFNSAFSENFKINQKTLCYGKKEISEENSGSIAFEGWAWNKSRSSPIKTILIISNDKVIGLGRQYYSEYHNSHIAGEKLAVKMLNYSGDASVYLHRLTNLHNSWYGIAKKPIENFKTLKFYGILDNNQVCEIKF